MGKKLSKNKKKLTSLSSGSGSCSNGKALQGSRCLLPGTHPMEDACGCFQDGGCFIIFPNTTPPLHGIVKSSPWLSSSALLLW